MAFDPLAFLAVNDVSWRGQVAGLEPRAGALSAVATDAEARVATLEGGIPSGGPLPNPVTARTIGPATSVDTGWQDLGGTDHSFRIEAAATGDTGLMSSIGDLYLFCDTGDGSPNYGLKVVNVGSSQSINFYYRNAGTWTIFSGGEATGGFGRSILKEDVVDYSYANSTITITLNGVPIKTFPVSVFQGKFPNGLGRFARYVRTSGTYVQKTTLSGGVISPLTTRTIELDANAFPMFTFDYTGSPYGYVARILDGSGNAITSWKAATLVENGTKGRATYRGPDKAPQVSVGYTYQLTEATADGAPKGGVVPISKSIVAPGPMQFGVNVTFDLWHNNPRRNRVCNYRSNWSSGNYPLNSWADPVNPQMKADFSGPTTEALQQLIIDNQTTGPLTTGPNASPAGTKFPHQGDGSGKGGMLEVTTPRLNGQRTRLRWKGVPGNMEAYNLWNTIRNQKAGTDGTYSWVDFDHVYNVAITLTNGAPSDQINALWRYSISGGVTPTEIEAFYIDANGNALATGYWDPEYIADMRHFVGHSTNAARMMDVQRIINMYDRTFTSSQIADGMTRLPDNGWGYEMCFSFFEEIGVGGQVHIPLQADESFVRKAARIGALWSARTKLVSAWEISNEPWNSGQFTWGAMVNLGKAMGMTAYKSDGNGGQVIDENGIYIKYHSYLQGLMMRWVTEEYAKVPGATQYLKRVINVQNASPANTRSVFLADPNCALYTDEIQSAPYLGNGYAKNFPYNKDDPSVVTDAMLDEYINRIKTEAIPTVFANAAAIRDFALSQGKSFGCYEGLLEDPVHGNFFARLKNDNVRWPALVTYILTEYKRMVGGHYRGYYDNSLAWGFRAHVSQSPDGSVNGLPPALGLKAWYDFIAAQPTI